MKIDISQVSETHLIIYLGEKIDTRLAGKIGALSEKIRHQFRDVLREVIPSYTSILIEFNPLKVDAASLKTAIYKLMEHPDSQSDVGTGKLITLPVYYGEDVGPDLASLAKSKGLSVEEVINYTPLRFTRCVPLVLHPALRFWHPLMNVLPLPATPPQEFGSQREA